MNVLSIKPGKSALWTSGIWSEWASVSENFGWPCCGLGSGEGEPLSVVAAATVAGACLVNSRPVLALPVFVRIEQVNPPA